MLLLLSRFSHVRLCATPWTATHQAPRPWDFAGKNTGVGCHFLLQCVKVKSLSRVRLSATPWTTAHQAPPPMGFSRQEYWSRVPLPSLSYSWGALKLGALLWSTGIYSILQGIITPRRSFYSSGRYSPCDVGRKITFPSSNSFWYLEGEQTSQDWIFPGIRYFEMKEHSREGHC